MTGSLQLTPLIRYLETGWSFFLLSGKCFPFHPVPLHPNCSSFLNFLFSHSEKAKKFKCWTHQEALSSCFHFCIKGTHDCVPSNPLNIRRYSEGKASYYLPGRAMLRGNEPTAKGSQPPFSFLEGVWSRLLCHSHMPGNFFRNRAWGQDPWPVRKKDLCGLSPWEKKTDREPSGPADTPPPPPLVPPAAIPGMLTAIKNQAC